MLERIPAEVINIDDWSSQIVLKNILFRYKYITNILTQSVLQSDYSIGQDSVL